VVVTRNTVDMRPLYGRALPAGADAVLGKRGPGDRGSHAQRHSGDRQQPGRAARDAGRRRLAHRISAGLLPAAYAELPSDRFLEQIIEKIVAFVDDPGFHGHFSSHARLLAATKHDIRHNTDVLEREFAALAARRTGSAS
jgi:hypothetical protein